MNPRVSPRETGFPSPPAILPRSSAVSLAWSNGVLPRGFPLAGVAVRPDTCRFTARQARRGGRRFTARHAAGAARLARQRAYHGSRGWVLPGSHADRLDCAPAPPTMEGIDKFLSKKYEDFFPEFCIKMSDFYVLFF